jgi:hypothetical protein
MMAPFQFHNLVQLLEYLASHSDQPACAATFSVKMALEGGDQAHDAIVDQLRDISNVIADDLISVQFRCSVDGVEQVAQLFLNSPYRIQRIAWAGQGHRVTIDCKAREIEIATDSLSFVELCRHKMTAQGVRKMTVDLKIR